MVSGVRRVSVKESVAEQILDLIHGQRYTIGQRLPTESQLMAITGGGRSSIREALHGLAVLGILEIRQGSGTYVRSLAPRPFGDDGKLIADALSMGITEDLLEARAIVEVRIASLASQRAGVEDFEDMERLLATAREGLAARRPVFEVGAEFHLSVARAAHNVVLERFVTSYQPLLAERGARLGRLPGYSEWEVADHSAIFEAIRRRDVRKAAQRMRTHLEGMTVHYEHLSAYRPRLGRQLRPQRAERKTLEDR
jgi:GntR family transcriptional repressor for pyruvate dehydrogenase complex